MDQEKSTPQWLIDTQNRSWEPEILISGITLTFLFLLPDHLYNFFAMLIQDYGVFDAVSDTLYMISIVFLNGLKITLIIHLILRGIWTGLIGISYAFPKGINVKNLKIKKTPISYEKPEFYVIQLEKLCSLLFSFIFSSIQFFLGLIYIFGVIILLFVFRIPTKYILTISFWFAIATVIFVTIVSIYESKTKKLTKINKFAERTIFSFIFKMYMTNLGAKKTLVLFFFYFSLIFLLSISSIQKFDFENDEAYSPKEHEYFNMIDPDLYDNTRNKNLRINKATIKDYYVSGQRLDIEISYFKDDEYTLTLLKENPKLLDEFKLKANENELNLFDLIKFSIDNEIVEPRLEMVMKVEKTNQILYHYSIVVDELDIGNHNLVIDKLNWNLSKKIINRIENWVNIPFNIK